MGGITDRAIGRLVDLILEMDCVLEVGEELARRGEISEGWGGRGQGVGRDVVRAELRDVLQDVLGSGGLSQGDGNLGWLSVKDAAKITNISEKTIRRWIGSGKLQASKVGSQWRIRSVAFEALAQKIENSEHDIFDADKEAEKIVHLHRTSKDK